MLPRSAVSSFAGERWPCSLDDVRRGTRLGMGPCQGGYCTFRAAGLVAERVAADGAGGDDPATSDRVLVDFLAERYKGTRPIAWGRQLQELWLTAGMYWGAVGVRRLVDPQTNERDGPRPAATEEKPGASGGGPGACRCRRVWPGSRRGDRGERPVRL